MNPWWTPQAAGWVGAGIGIAGGIFGTIVGLSGAFLRTPRQFALVRAFMLSYAAIAAIAVLVGVYALIIRQPYHVWYPLLLFGVIATILPIVLLPTLRNRLRVMEQRRLESAALRRG